MRGTTKSSRRRGAHLAPRPPAWGACAILAAAAVVATVVVGLLSGTGGSYALWNGSVTANAGTLSAGHVKVSQQLVLPAYTYASGSTSITGSATVTNAGNVAADFTANVSLDSGSSSALAQAIWMTVWAGTDAASCTASATPANGFYSGSLATLVAWTSPVASVGSLPPGGVYVYCVRMSLNVHSVPGVQSGATVLPVFRTTLTAGSWADSVSTSTQQTFIDDIAPTAPGPLSAAHTTFASAVVSWPAATDNVGVTGYTVYRNGVQIASLSPSAISLTDGSVLAGSSYTYTVKAADAVGHVSTSAPLTVAVPMTDATAWYRVANVKSGLCVSSQNSGSTDGTSLQQSACASPTLTSQSWQFQGPNADGYYTVVPRNAPTLAWDISGAGTTDGTWAVLWTASGVVNQQWQAVPLGGGRFQYVARNSGKCLQVSGGSTTSGAVLQQSSCDSSDLSQIFRLTPVTPLSTLMCTPASNLVNSVQYSWAAPVTGDANTAGYRMFVNGQPSNPATTATRDNPLALYNADYNTAQLTGRVSIEVRQELISGGEVSIGTGSVVVGTDGTYTCG